MLLRGYRRFGEAYCHHIYSKLIHALIFFNHNTGSSDTWAPKISKGHTAFVVRVEATHAVI